MNCPKCSGRSYKDGFYGESRRQRFQCRDCGTTFYDPSVPHISVRGKWDRNRRMPESVKQKISRTQREKQAMGFHIGAPRKNPVYRFRCRICQVFCEDMRGNTARKVCSKRECRLKAMDEGRRKLPDDSIIAELYLSGLACTEIAGMFGVHHQAVLHACERAGVKRRKHTTRQHCKEKGCERRVYRIWHVKLQVWYGTRCKAHLNE